MVEKKNSVKNHMEQGLIKLSGNELSISFIYSSTHSAYMPDKTAAIDFTA